MSLGNLNPGTSGERQVTLLVDAGADFGSIITSEAIFDDAATNAVMYRGATRVQDDTPVCVRVVASPDAVRPTETMDIEITLSNEGLSPARKENIR